MQPLFATSNDGKVTPIVIEDDKRTIKLDNISLEELHKKLATLQEEDFQLNQAFRVGRNLQRSYWYNHFAVEGRVLACVDDKGVLFNRDALYKIKPMVRVIKESE
jgi:hypothetical protein